MIKMKASRVFIVGAVVAVLSLMSTSLVTAETIKSNNYEVTEAQFGIGSERNMCSEDGEYCAQASIGNLSGDSQSSGSFTAKFEPIAEDSEPLLEVIVEPGESNLGVLSADRTATKTAIVKVRNYLSDGYMLYMTGPAPNYQGYALATSATPTASTMGSEQFAVNVVSNTLPTIGFDPVQQPSLGFSFGQAAPGYNTPDLFAYEDGATIARSDRETGQTDYTISMIVNVSANTPAGHFVGDYSVVVVPVF